jgi:S-adenosylmethionine hydrolase
VKNTVIIGIQAAYMAEEPGQMLAIVDSKGYLEIAVNRGSAAMILGSGIGDKITVTPGK